jgi:DNA repair protein RecO (recombination protein O)
MKGGTALITEGDVGAGLKLTAHFIERRVLWPRTACCRTRARMIERLAGEGRL